MGMMVMAESFDMWIYPKCKNGYAKFFKEWADRDIENLVLHHRNHPSIVMWSIGNEIPEQSSKEGVEISRHLDRIGRYGIGRVRWNELVFIRQAGGSPSTHGTGRMRQRLRAQSS